MVRRLQRVVLCSFLAATLDTAVRTPAILADDADRITVTVSGQASVRPDVAEIQAEVTGSAQIAAEALKKFRESRRRAAEAIEKLKLKDLKFEGSGPAIQSGNPNAQQFAQVFGGAANAQQPNNVTVAEMLVIRLSSIDRLKDEEVFEAIVKIVDATKDAGMATGARPISMMEYQMSRGARSDLATFRSTKLAEARAAATRAAMQTARERANALAKLSNTTVARVVSIRESAAPGPAKGGGGAQNAYLAMMFGGGESSGDGDGTASTALKPIVVTVTLEAQFATSGGK